jgi:hypothetical protein
MQKSNRKRRTKHPFLVTDGRNFFHKNSNMAIGLDKVYITRHHLYPKDRKDLVEVAKENFILKIWSHKHFFGWNRLFQFCYKELGREIHTELTIDEIVTMMIEKHWFITKKVGTKAWKIVFKEKTIDEAIDLLCRLISRKYGKETLKAILINIKMAFNLIFTKLTF